MSQSCGGASRPMGVRRLGPARTVGALLLVSSAAAAATRAGSLRITAPTTGSSPPAREGPGAKSLRPPLEIRYHCTPSPQAPSGHCTVSVTLLAERLTAPARKHLPVLRDKQLSAFRPTVAAGDGLDGLQPVVFTLSHATLDLLCRYHDPRCYASAPVFSSGVAPSRRIESRSSIRLRIR